MPDHRLDLDGLGAALDPVEDWHTLDGPALAAALTARGCDDTVALRIVDDVGDPFVDRLLDRYFAEDR